MPASLSDAFLLDPEIVLLNHGSYARPHCFPVAQLCAAARQRGILTLTLTTAHMRLAM